MPKPAGRLKQPLQTDSGKNQNNTIMKKLEIEKMEELNGGWELVCDLNWGLELSWGDSFYGYYSVSNCKFYF